MEIIVSLYLPFLCIKLAASYGVEEFPTLVFFKHGIPSICEQDLTDNEEVRTVNLCLSVYLFADPSAGVQWGSDY